MKSSRDDGKFDGSQNEQLDQWFGKVDDRHFPSFNARRGEASYKERYTRSAQALIPVHNEVEKSALAKSFQTWLTTMKKRLKEEKEWKPKQISIELSSVDPLVYLNNHGIDHIQDVINRATQLASQIAPNYRLTAYEVFFLLCAIQVHDTGNIYGRDGHEKKCVTVLDNTVKAHIPDSLERKIIEHLALTHGGAYIGDDNTIGRLEPEKTIHERPVRMQLLAAILRFADELADDHTRVSKELEAYDTVPESSKIYHRYSESLQSVKIIDTPIGRKAIKLNFDLPQENATETFSKYNQKNIFLLDEIYNRTIKMERERRYCMSFMRPYLSIDEIKVEIVIHRKDQPLNPYKYQYTLSELGYPKAPERDSIKQLNNDLPSGQEQKEKMGGIVK